MSDQEVVKGTEFKYTTFLWAEINGIRLAQKHGDTNYAIELAISLVDYLPKGIKKKFEEKANIIRKTLAYVRKLPHGVDLFTHGIVENRKLQQISKSLLANFMKELCDELDARGYMEKVKTVRKRKFGE